MLHNTKQRSRIDVGAAAVVATAVTVAVAVFAHSRARAVTASTARVGPFFLLKSGGFGVDCRHLTDWSVFRAGEVLPLQDGVGLFNTRTWLSLDNYVLPDTGAIAVKTSEETYYVAGPDSSRTARMFDELVAMLALQPSR
jgi:hypothetical protein